MGADFYSRRIPGECDPAAALRQARAQVFAEGTFRGAEEKPSSPEAAVIAAGVSGTGSILDIARISEREETGAANGLDNDELLTFFGTEHPSREAIQSSDELAEGIDRGCARYVRAYEGDVCTGTLFLGYSLD